MLIGLASKNAILIVEFANQLREQGLEIVEAVKQAAIIRFRRFYRLVSQPSQLKDRFACCDIYVGIIPVSSDIPLQTGEFTYVLCLLQ